MRQVRRIQIYGQRRPGWLFAQSPPVITVDNLSWLRAAQRPDDVPERSEPQAIRAAWLTSPSPAYGESLAFLRQRAPIPPPDPPLDPGWASPRVPWATSPAPAYREGLAWLRQRVPIPPPDPAPHPGQGPALWWLSSPAPSYGERLGWFARRPIGADGAALGEQPRQTGSLFTGRELLNWRRPAQVFDAPAVQPDAPRSMPWLTLLDLLPWLRAGRWTDDAESGAAERRSDGLAALFSVAVPAVPTALIITGIDPVRLRMSFTSTVRRTLSSTDPVCTRIEG